MNPAEPPSEPSVPGNAGRPPDLRLVEDIFFKVAPLAPADREQTIRHLCAGNADLELEVRSLIESAARVGVFLERPALGKDIDQLTSESQAPDLPDDLLGTLIGPFRVERRIASGGMGAVYVAVRSDGQFDQKVAIKVIKRGMDSEQMLTRFRAEIQALAALDHPNIARLIDGGVMADGRPFLAMEYIDGAPIDEYCDHRNLRIAERVELFRRVCDAVHHAHQNLVIHRDIKPSNLLVTPQGVPKLLDFGIAKLLKGGDTEPAVTAETDRRLTPEYASPEQIDGRPIGTAADIYALGVVLYELLAGVRPYTFAARTEDEIRRVVCQAVPPPPSAVVGAKPRPPHTAPPAAPPTPAGTAESGATPAAATGRTSNVPRTRGVTSTRLRSALRGDLDNIVMFALRKEPQRRYSSAEQFSADLGRYLAGMPVLARRDTLSYRASKFIGRHRVAVALLVGAIATHSVLTGMLYDQRLRLTRQRDELAASNSSLQATRTYLTNILEAGGSGIGSLGPEAPLGAVVREAIRELRDAPPADPLTRAAAEQAIGRTSMSLGMFPEAREYLERAEAAYATLDPRSDALVDTRIALAELLFYERRTADAQARFADLLSDERAASAGRPTVRAGVLLNNLGAAQRASNDAQAAIATHREALDVRIALHGQRSLEVAESHNNLGSALLQSGDVKAALQELETSLAIRADILRADHPLVVRARANLGLAQLRHGRTDDAITNLRQAADLWERAFGPAHPGRVGASTSLAQALAKQQKFDEALQRLHDARAWQVQRFPEGSSVVAATDAHIGVTLEAAGRPSDALPILERVIPVLESEGATYSGVLATAREALARIRSAPR